jgi:hypothetical protein
MIPIWTLFIFSLLLPSFTFTDGQNIYGYSLLFFGWLGILMPFEVQGWYCWYVNILFVIQPIFFFRRNIGTLILGIITSLLSFRTIFITEIWLNEGVPSQIQTREFGYYLWLSALLLISGYSIYKYLKK